MTHSEFQGIFSEHYLSVLKYAIKILDDRQDGEDVTADVFVKLWKHGAEGIRDIKSWLLISTRNACMNFLVSKKRRSVLDQHYQNQFDEFVVMQAENIRSEYLKRAMAEIINLPARRKDAIGLSLLGYNLDAIALKMKMKKTSARNQKCRAVVALKLKFSNG